MIYLLFILLLILIIINILINKKDPIAPSVIFNFSFLFCTFWCLINYKIWNLKSLHIYTFLTILIGVLVYSITCTLISEINKNKVKSKNNEEYYVKSKLKIIELPKWIKIVTIILELLTIIFLVYNVLKVTNGTISNFLTYLKEYDHIVKFSNKIVRIPKLLSIMITLSTMLSYYFIYILINNFLLTRKIDFLLLITIVLSMILQLSTGGRNGAVNIVLASIAIFIFLYRKNKSNILKINKKTAIILLTIIIFSGLMLFPISTKLVGRENKKSAIEYLSIYCGAEIKNLDIYIKERENKEYNHQKGNQTFIYLIEFVGKRFGYERNYKLDLPFRSVNGHSLGNVYTTFYQFIYDYGYFGVVWCTVIMASITQLIYEKGKKSKIKNIPNIYIIIYGYIISSILLSFFSNKFYEQNFGGSLFYGIIIWMILNYYLKEKDDKHEKVDKKELCI